MDFLTPLESQIRTVKTWTLSVADALEPGEWLARPEGVKNHPYWLFGHVVVSSDFLPTLAETESVIPPEWNDLFGVGSIPDPSGSEYPSIQELSEVLTLTMDRNLSGLRELDPVEFQKPPVGLPEQARRHFDTRERWLFFAPLHLSYHLGQIQQIRNGLHSGSGGT